MLERLAKDKHSSLLGQFITYKNEVSWIQSREQYYKYLIFFVIE